jgi:tetratricopeptide (TPR) repeat protein
VIAANLHLGACERVQANWDAAVAAYGMAAQSAAVIGDVMNVLKARIAEANLAMARGNLPRAEQILDDTIESAEQAGLDEMRSFALQDRGAVARQRGDLDLAIRCGYEALSGMREQAARDRALVDLAVAFYDLGLRTAARDANLLIVATAQEQYTRWVATINLMEIAAMDRREPVFEQYRRELAAAELPATLAAYYFLYVGQGYRMFHKAEQARRALDRALDVAARHKLNEVIIKAEQSLRDLADGGVIITSEMAEPSEAVAEVATAIREMRTLAGVAG